MASVLVMACASAQVLPRYIRDKEIKPTYNEMVVKKYIDSINVVVDVDSVFRQTRQEETVLNNPCCFIPHFIILL